MKQTDLVQVHQMQAIEITSYYKPSCETTDQNLALVQLQLKLRIPSWAELI